MKAPSCSARAKNGRNFGSDNSWPSTLVRISTPFSFRVVHDVVEFADRDLRLLQGDDAESDKAVGFARAKFRHAVIGEAMGGFGDLGIDRVITLSRRGCDDLNVDAHAVEMGQAPVDRGHDLADILFLLRVDLLGGGVGEMRQRDAGHVDMRLRQLGGLGHDDVGMNIDRRRRTDAGRGRRRHGCGRRCGHSGSCDRSWNGLCC